MLIDELMRELSEARERSARIGKRLEGQVRSNSHVLHRIDDIHRFKKGVIIRPKTAHKCQIFHGGSSIAVL